MTIFRKSLDASMQAFLASTGSIVGDDEDAAPVSSATSPRLTPAAEPAPKDDILNPDGGLTVNDIPAPPLALAAFMTQTPPNEAGSEMISPGAAQATATSISQLKRGVTQNRMAGVSHNGPTLDDLVREEVRPILKAWID